MARFDFCSVATLFEKKRVAFASAANAVASKYAKLAALRTAVS